jgi:hypothetical protein
VPAQQPSVRPGTAFGRLRDVRPRDYAIRFALGALISVIAGIVGKAVGPRVGGVFLAFPAILPASLTLIQEKEGTRRADRDAIGAVLGALALVAFAATAEAGFKGLEPYLAVVVALFGWLVVSVALYAGLCWLRPEDCDRNRD